MIRSFTVLGFISILSVHHSQAQNVQTPLYVQAVKCGARITHAQQNSTDLGDVALPDTFVFDGNVGVYHTGLFLFRPEGVYYRARTPLHDSRFEERSDALNPKEKYFLFMSKARLEDGTDVYIHEIGLKGGIEVETTIVQNTPRKAWHMLQEYVDTEFMRVPSLERSARVFQAIHVQLDSLISGYESIKRAKEEFLQSGDRQGLAQYAQQVRHSIVSPAALVQVLLESACAGVDDFIFKLDRDRALSRLEEYQRELSDFFDRQ